MHLMLHAVVTLLAVLQQSCCWTAVMLPGVAAVHSAAQLWLHVCQLMQREINP
jgi:hypothetical protein